jgi:hypothetical protein
MEKTIEEMEEELRGKTISRAKAMMTIFKLREGYGEQYLQKKRGRVRSEEELRRLAEACRLNWKFMEEVGMIRRNDGEILVRI